MFIGGMLFITGCTEQQTTEDINNDSNNDLNETQSIVALVNGEEITTNEVSSYAKQNELTEKESLEQLIDQILLLQQAKQQGYNVNLTEAESTLKDYLSQQNQTVDAYKQYLQQQGISYQNHLENYSEQLSIQHYQEDVLQTKEYNISDQETETNLENYLAEQNITLEDYKHYLQQQDINYEEKLQLYKEALQQRLLIESLREEADIKYR